MIDSTEAKEQYTIVKQFSEFKSVILSYLENNSSDDKTPDYIQNLMLLPVTPISLFHENKWDYNGSPEVSPNSRGSAMIINYSAYPNIPEFIITEIKCLTYLYFTTPKSFLVKGRKKSKIKPNTLVGVTTMGLAFIDFLFESMCAEFGEEYVHRNFYSMTEVDRYEFKEAATKYERTYTTDLKIFLDNLSHPFAKFIFNDLVACANSKSFSWNVVRKPKEELKPNIIPDEDFEKIAYYASITVSDFLVTQDISVEDKKSLTQLNLGSHGITLPSTFNINRHILNAYAALRLCEAGYSDSMISSILKEDSPFSNGRNGTASRATISSRLFEQTGSKIGEIERTFANVKYAALYIIAQFTGMRPSELCIISFDCLIEEGGFSLLKGRISKGKTSYINGLFDDKWLAIDIVKDALNALSRLNKIYRHTLLYSNTFTLKPGAESTPVYSPSISSMMGSFFDFVYENNTPFEFYTYMTRHTLAYLMFRADLGLPYISYQLKHLVEDVTRYTTIGQHSSVTLCYGGIGDELAKGTRGLRKKAEVEGVKSIMNPDGVYLGEKGAEHKENIQKLFQGYMAEGYTKDDIYEALAEQGVALINVGQGFCYGGRAEDFDDSIPCIGSLRCNPIRCKNAIVTKSNAPKWREVYLVNKMNIDKPEFAENVAQMKAAMDEAQLVLSLLGEKVIL